MEEGQWQAIEVIATAWHVFIAALALYLLDCVCVLERGQALLVRGKGGWHLDFGSPSFTLGGRPVALTNPFFPWRITLKTLPLFAASSSGELRPSGVVRDFSPTAWLTMMQSVLVFVVLPVLLYRLPGLPFVVGLLIAYSFAIVILILVARRLVRAGAPTSKIITNALSAFICLPLSVNAMRRGTLLLTARGDASAMLRITPAQIRIDARHSLCAHIREGIAETGEESQRRAQLENLQHALGCDVDERT